MFQWYWEKFLSKVFGVSDWGANNNMYYITVMECRISTQYSTKRRLATPFHEAKAIIIWWNNEEKWKYLYEWTQKPENQGQSQPSVGGLWTDNEQGQQENCAWKAEGVAEYNKASKEIGDAWVSNKAQVKAMEKQFLEHLRKKKKLECDNYDQEQKLKKRNKRRLANQKPPAENKKQCVLSTTTIAGWNDDEED